jgi:hypothetical protein
VAPFSLCDVTIPAADIGPVNPLPPFAVDADAHAEITAGPDVDEEDRRYVGYGMVAAPLPYLMQDGYGRQRAPRRFRAAVLDNGLLRATFLPEVGGRLWSLVHVPSGRELLFRNPIFQPSHFAIRNAWFAGGVEWNIGLVGHCPLTCSPLFAAEAAGPDGVPALRMWEWERIRGVCFQIDAWLPRDAAVLFVHVRIHNPNDRAVPMYWWSNIAMTETARTRVLVPATDAYTFGYKGGISRVPIPVWDGRDRTYPSKAPQAADYFFRLPADTRPWIAAVDADGAGLFQASTRLLKGRKLFVWGNNPGGRHWQEYLCGPRSAYLEIQAGLARTQAEHPPMPAGAEWRWTEAYGPLSLPPDDAHAEDWDLATAAAGRAINDAVPGPMLERAHAAAIAFTAAPARVFQRGGGWGALEARLCARQGRPSPIPAGMAFGDDSLEPAQEAWRALLEEGRMRTRSPEDCVRGIQVDPRWRALLEASVAKREGAAASEEDWCAWYHLGVMRAHDGERDAAAAAFEESLRLRTTAWAFRNLAVMERGRGNRARWIGLLCDALAERPDLPSLAVECGAALLEAGEHDRWLAIAAGLPPGVRDWGRVRLLIARAWLARGMFTELREYIASPTEIPDLREGEVSLSDLWFGLHEKEEEARCGRPLDEAGRARVRAENPPPVAVDFRMTVE